MKKKQWVRFASRNAAPALGILVLATMGGPVSARTGGSPQLPAHFGGVLSDYTPSAVNGTPINGGPYEMHGKWMLDLNPARSEATFSAAIAMETSEVVNMDPNFDPGTLGAHTHHISVTGGVVHNGPMDWQTMCPAVSSVTGGFVVTGSAYVTANGANPPFGNQPRDDLCPRCVELAHSRFGIRAVVEFHADHRGAGQCAFRAAGHPWRRLQVRQPGRRRTAGLQGDRRAMRATAHRGARHARGVWSRFCLRSLDECRRSSSGCSRRYASRLRRFSRPRSWVPDSDNIESGTSPGSQSATRR